MFSSLANKIFGDSNSREIKKFEPLLAEIAGFEDQMKSLDDDGLRGQTDRLRERLAAGETLDQLLPEAFATVREAAIRSIGQRHFDVQMMGGVVLHQGRITEMKTGEGKTLVSTLAAYLNALEGKGVHIVTVNDYLASRDAAWMGQIYRFLGLSVGCITHELTDDERRAAYAADITYGTNNELGFDYLRDNMKFRLEDMVQREPSFAIIDEVDSILIDEARTPLVISGPSDQPSELYARVDGLAPMLAEEDYDLDEKQRSVTLTETGIEHVEMLLKEAGIMDTGTLYDASNISFLHHVNMAVRAHRLFQRDTHYMVKNGQILIIDEFTGRAMEGRRFGDGQHQALEAKEGLNVQPENQTLASITYQNLFRMYPKLAGMTGTAMTEAGEFSEIYGLDVVAIPTNKDVQRADHDDEVYRTSAERDAAVIAQIMDCRDRGQPVLVGTVTIEKSEALSASLKKANIPHQVLNARFHEQEAMIIADAGIPGAVTIATNMAGRGTDIQLGGNLEKRLADDETDQADAITAEVKAAKETALGAGGLYVIGTERHESRRIDNQLRGRSGRQGDPGNSKFFISLEDDLMRIFGSERLDGMLQKLGLEDGEAIIHPWINKAIEKAQSKVEARNFEIRKQLLKYDDVMNDQRRVIFDQRKDIMRTEEVVDTITDMRSEVVADLVADAIPEGSYPDQWDATILKEGSIRYLGLDIPAEEWFREDGMDPEAITERLENAAATKMAEKAVRFTPDVMRVAEKSLLLQVLDQQWKDHLLALDHMKQAVGLRSYAQKDPLNEYKREAFILFEQFLVNLRQTTTSVLAHIELKQPEPPVEAPAPSSSGGGANPGMHAATVETSPMKQGNTVKVSRNAPCPCGSGKKFKHCCGRV
ncbi:MAG: Protein translocase subunit SecA [SAR116 cluster bacterium MED-G04]|jgi:preprotein translocase subunit SecA|nr:preprotein translocase subunit SecA [SAR116 cluster bacterium]OUW37227.1 MAG: preprotein translocase subunit SecA [Gammaproteobacteria bacterium TMED183]CAI8410473.1 MAG: Protein translocase subunit SecA [SAR116 cluster bacterium MED-G04]HCD49396.1 preprotein translocase subunit SecA [Alphaproteobacteria bacterium]|tara:strand:- start:525 stop:3155 length:2631 start_codon:yes stop_codon:yes gene_type:complete